MSLAHCIFFAPLLVFKTQQHIMGFLLIKEMTIVLFEYNYNFLVIKNHYVVAKAIEMSCDVMVL
jgi:hypothetical protein